MTIDIKENDTIIISGNAVSDLQKLVLQKLTDLMTGFHQEEDAKKYFTKTLGAGFKKRKIEHALNVVTHFYDTNLEQMKSKTRLSHVKEARQMMMHFLIEECALTTGAAGKFFNRDHATAIHAKKFVKKNFWKEYCELFAEARNIGQEISTVSSSD